MILWEEIQVRAAIRLLRELLRGPGRVVFKEFRKRLREYDGKKSTVDFFRQPCLSCGDNTAQHIDFHHINPLKKERSIVSLPRDFPELKKCIPLCANCHRDFHCNVNKKHMEIIDEIEH